LVETAFTAALTGWRGIDACVARARIATVLMGLDIAAEQLWIGDWKYGLLREEI
jgi:hypothetical protein